MRILFLDFDGVLNTRDFVNKHGAMRTEDGERVAALDPENVAHLNTLVAATRCIVVLSTAHRIAKTPEQALKRCNAALKVAGYTGPTIVYTTPDLSKGDGLLVALERRKEITKWLEEHADIFQPLTALRYVVLDDSVDAWPTINGWEAFGAFARTSSTYGLTSDKAEAIIQFLLEVPA